MGAGQSEGFQKSTHPALITEEVFEAVRKKIFNRTRKVIHPRIISSNHLLSGFLRCKKCGGMLTPTGAKSGKFVYYTCQTYLKSGRDYCTQKMIPAKKLEPFAIETIKEKILTNENIARLLRTLNDEASRFDEEYEDKVAMIDEVLNEKLNRRAKLYEGIETGAMDLKDISPRLKDLNQEIEALQAQKVTLKEKHEKEVQIAISEEAIRPYVEDLRQTLMNGSIVERRGFLRSFITKITVDYPTATLEYTVPLPVKTKDRTSTEEVLSLVQNGVRYLAKVETTKINGFNWLREFTCAKPASLSCLLTNLYKGITFAQITRFAKCLQVFQYAFSTFRERRNVINVKLCSKICSGALTAKRAPKIVST